MSRKGIDFENRVEAYLEDLGYNCDRDTNGPYDVLALAPQRAYMGTTVFMVECKSSSDYSPSRASSMLPPEEWNALVDRAERYGAFPVLATGRPYSKAAPDFWQLEAGHKPGGWLEPLDMILPDDVVKSENEAD